MMTKKKVNKKPCTNNKCKVICTECKYIQTATDKHKDFLKDSEGDYLCTKTPKDVICCVDNSHSTVYAKCKTKNKGNCKQYKKNKYMEQKQKLIDMLEDKIHHNESDYSFPYHDTVKKRIIQDAINIIKGEKSEILINDCHLDGAWDDNTIIATPDLYKRTTTFYDRELEYKKTEERRRKTTAVGSKRWW